MATSVTIKPSTKKEKKYMATFMYSDGKTKLIHFGAKGYPDFTLTGDEAKKKLYLARHVKRENWEKFDTAGSLARYILWNKKTLEESIKDYKKRFSLK